MERQVKTKKGEETRKRILEVALDLFTEHGYEGTSMRRVAEAAGVSVGNAYYYYASKEHLIQGIYGRIHAEHRRICGPILEKEKKLKPRLRAVLRAKIDTARPYHKFAAVLFRSAADPDSPLNPFSDDSKKTRDEAMDLMKEVVEGADSRIAKDLRAELPELLWLHLMSIILFWLHDSSPEQKRTYILIDTTVDLITKIIGVASLPLMRPLRRSGLSILTRLREESSP
jgi:AcrR family transcriptional regulator